MLAYQEQRHALEIQRLQDKMTTTKPNHWDMMNNVKHFKFVSGDRNDWDEFSTKFRSQVAAGDGGGCADGGSTSGGEGLGHRDECKL